MEKLILKCGRFVPSASGNVEQRVAHIETYLGRLTEEMEHLAEAQAKAMSPEMWQAYQKQIEDIKKKAERVYAGDYLTSLYESMFTGMTTGTAMLYARYFDYEDTESGTVSLVKDNREKGYTLTAWTYDFSTMRMVKESNSTFVTVEVERYATEDASRRETAKLYFVKENGEWYLDSPSF